MLNKVELIGYVGQNPRVQYMPNGQALANFSIATNETYNKDVGNGQKEKVTKTTWHNCVAYGKLAEIIGQYVKQGSLLFVSGSLQQNKPYTDQNGVTHHSYSIKIDEMKMLPSSNSASNEKSPSKQQNTNNHKATAPQTPVEDIDDDIPF